MKKLVALFVVITIWELLFPGRACAQDDYTLFRDRAGESSILFRGHKSYDYYMLFNGTPFWTSPEYHPGTVIYSGKFYHDIELNIDAARQDDAEMLRVGKDFLKKHGKDTRFILQMDRATSYGAYRHMQDLLMQIFLDVREEKAQSTYGKSMKELSPEELTQINDLIPLSISETDMKNR